MKILEILVDETADLFDIQLSENHALEYFRKFHCARTIAWLNDFRKLLLSGLKPDVQASEGLNVCVILGLCFKI